ncbi:hypothetical protein AEAC466_15475 [Asticcacaulis sp. AC466]|uniref:hypothetical protein n=1 Tax=Asticcacaulis sp. AC466 TaxID=1282362 RepID=UPI0003C3C7A2|nr:hypothetical protein [Asticcacaulis sp. AC466]ESQ82905.1 hypothetical protein AEAC466_15475 [Asticcacaulis sp. AC466]
MTDAQSKSNRFKILAIVSIILIVAITCAVAWLALRVDRHDAGGFPWYALTPVYIAPVWIAVIARRHRKNNDKERR